MGCSISMSSNRAMWKRAAAAVGENDAVSLCRERKRMAKKAVKQRKVFGDAHFGYLQSLSSVSSAVALFVARYSAINHSQFLLSFAPSSDFAANQKCSEEEEEEEEEEEGSENEVVCEHFYDDVVSQSQREDDVSWDFFNLLDTGNYAKPNAVEKEKEKEKEKKKDGKGEEKGKGRELLEALKNVEEYFVKAYDSALHVSRMLEVDQIPHFHQIQPQEISTKWSGSSQTPSSKSLLSSTSRSTSSTCAESRSDHKSLLSSSSESSSALTESKTGVTDGSWGMVSGSHSFTLGRLYAWEKKLYHEVKTGDETRKAYKQSCSRLREKDLEGGELCPSKAASEVTDLYHRMLVTFQRAETISKQIEKLRDEELQPQLVELLHGLMRTWKAMSETHEIQKTIMHGIRSFSCPDNGNFCNDSHRLATLELEAVVQNWHSCFSDYVSAQKSYVKSLHGWLSKFVDAEAEYYYKGSSSLPPIRFNGPALMVICQSWLTSLDRLPNKAVKHAMKTLAKDIQALWVQQGEERALKMKVDELVKELNRKLLAVKRAEDKALMSRHIAQSNAKDQNDSLGEKKNQLDLLKKRIELEKERYHNSMQETKRVTINGLQTGFSSVFESLAEFSRASEKVYAHLVTFARSTKDLR